MRLIGIRVDNSVINRLICWLIGHSNTITEVIDFKGRFGLEPTEDYCARCKLVLRRHFPGHFLKFWLDCYKDYLEDWPELYFYEDSPP